MFTITGLRLLDSINLNNKIWITSLEDVKSQMKVYSVVRPAGDTLINALLSYSYALKTTFNAHCGTGGE